MTRSQNYLRTFGHPFTGREGNARSAALSSKGHLFRALSLPFYGLFHLWMRTLDARIVFYDPRLDPAYPESGDTKRIYTFWHEAIAGPLYLRGRCGMTMLLSRHGDAEVVGLLARRLGFGMVRGSTGHGGTHAVREMFDLCLDQRSHLTITVDGPRGPRYHFSKGAVYIASRTGMPIVPMGWVYARPWRIRRAWDRFAVPRPFSRLRAIVGPEIHVPPRANRDQLEYFRRKLETIQRQLTVLAEDWAESGQLYDSEYTIGVGPNSVPRDICSLHHFFVPTTSQEL